MNKKLRISVILICGLILASVVSACSSNNQASPSPSGSVSTQGAEASPDASPSGTESAAPGADPLGKYDPPIEVTSVRDVGPATKFLPGESIDENDWTREIESVLGIKIKNVWVTNGEYNQKMNVTIASNELPDFFSVDANQLKMLGEGDQVADLTEAYNTYASPRVKELLDPYLASSRFDGKLLAIPNVASSLAATTNVIWIRMDWLRSLNLPEPQNMTDLFNISEAFTNQDPDRNNKNDTFGFAVEKGLFTYPSLDGFFNGFHAYPHSWIKNASGELVFGGIQPEIKAALTKLQELYKTGQLDKEFGVKDTVKVNESVTSGKVGIWIGPSWSPFWPLQDMKNNDPTVEWKPFPILSIDDQPGKAQMPNPIAAYYSVRKGYQHPEVVVKLMNLYIDRMFINPDYARFGAHDGIEPWLYLLVQTLNPDMDIVSAQNVEKALQTNDDSTLAPNEKSIYDNIRAYEAGDTKLWADTVVKDSRLIIGEMWNDNRVVADAFTGAATETMSSKGSALEKLIYETYTKIIMGANPDEFDRFVEDWSRLGGAQITKEVNEWYKSTQ